MKLRVSYREMEVNQRNWNGKKANPEFNPNRLSCQEVLVISVLSVHLTTKYRSDSSRRHSPGQKNQDIYTQKNLENRARPEGVWGGWGTLEGGGLLVIDGAGFTVHDSDTVARYSTI